MAIESLQALCTAMDLVALDTWQAMEDSWRPGWQFNETSATDANLRTLRTQVPGLLIWQSEREHSNEAKTGADWEWWVGSDAEGWLCLRMQAKRAYQSGSYERLDHAGSGEYRYQYDKLIGGCDPEQGFYPFHVFYNGWPEGTFRAGTHWAVPAAWNACPNLRGYDTCGHVEPRHYGCAIAPSRDVKQVFETGAGRKDSVIAHLTKAVPWSYAFGFPPQNQSEQRWYPGMDWGSWLDRVHATVEVLSYRGGASGTRDAASHLPEVPIERSRRTVVLPDYVQSMRETPPGVFVPTSAEEVPAAPRTVIVERATKRNGRRPR